MSTKDALIAAARDLMLDVGYPATTVDEICEAAGVSKGAFYHHFGSKEELGRATLDTFHADLGSAMSNGPFADIDDPIERFLAFLDHLREVSLGPLLRGGCLLGSFSHDLAAGAEVPGLALAEKFRVLRNDIAGVAAPALAARPGLGFTADQVADQLLALVEGGIVLSKAQGDTEPLDRVMTTIRIQMEMMLKG